MLAGVPYAALAAALIAAAMVAGRIGGKRLDALFERHYLLIAGVFCALYLLPSWILGPSSLVNPGDEGEQALALLLFRQGLPAGAAFSHAIAGGTELRAMFPQAPDAYFVDFASLLLTALPVWLAILMHKVVMLAAALGGATLLARRFTTRLMPALLSAMIYAYAFPWIGTSTLWGGAGYGIFPLAVYLLCFRTTERWFLPAALVLGAVSSLLSSWLLVLPSVGLGIVVGHLAFGTGRHGRFAFGLLLFVLPQAANAAPAIAALSATIPHSGRLLFTASRDQPLLDLFGILAGGVRTLLYILTIPALAILARPLPALSLRLAAALAAPAAIAVVIRMVPWESIHLDVVRAINLGYLMTAAAPAAIIAIAAALDQMRERAVFRGHAVGSMLAIALCAGGFAYARSIEAVNMVAFGGYRQLSDIPNLKDRPWQAPGLYRAVTIPGQISPNMLLLYGIEPFDSYVSIVARNYLEAWAFGFDRRGDLGAFKNSRANLTAADPRDQDFYDFDGRASAELLAIANVRYVVSRIPVTGHRLMQVSGPAIAGFRPLGQMNGSERLRARLGEHLRPSPVFVYEIQGTLPRAYFASSVTAAPSTSHDRAFFDLVARVGATRGIVAHSALSVSGAQALAQVIDLAAPEWGYQAEIHAPVGGVLVFNASPWPFWRASVDGQPAASQVVNGFQLAVTIPPGARSVELRYVRERGAGTASSLPPVSAERRAISSNF